MSGRARMRRLAALVLAGITVVVPVKAHRSAPPSQVREVRVPWHFPLACVRVPAGTPVGTVIAAARVPLPRDGLASPERGFLWREGVTPRQNWLALATSLPGVTLRIVAEKSVPATGRFFLSQDEDQTALRMELVTSGVVHGGRLTWPGPLPEYRIRDDRRGRVMQRDILMPGPSLAVATSPRAGCWSSREKEGVAS